MLCIQYAKICGQYANAKLPFTAYDLVNAKYAFSQPKGKDTIYDQPAVAQALLKRFLAINEKSTLSKLGKDVLQAVEKGSKDLASASSALEKLLESSKAE